MRRGAEIIPIFRLGNPALSPETRISLRELRKRNCREIDPLDRFEKALQRCQGADEKIVAVLMREHERLCQAKILRQRYVAPDGAFKRLSEAFSFVSEMMRREVLLVVRGLDSKTLGHLD
ncbi:MAG: hypothetical protein H7318_04070 [Oligoflexus sp.]|nr:hypothetical protein [Oligoflexus sp.]